MHYLMAMQFGNSIYDLLENKYSFLFRYFKLGVDLLLKSTSVTILDHHYLERFAFIRVKTFNQVVTIA